jgi:hypothetical protein
MTSQKKKKPVPGGLPENGAMPSPAEWEDYPSAKEGTDNPD